MSDYLNNIVSRSLSVADVVQPRVPHLFEQAPVETTPAPVLPVETVNEVRNVDEPGHTPASPKPQSPVVNTPVFEPLRSTQLREVFVPPSPVMPENSVPVTDVAAAPSKPSTPDEIEKRVRSITVTQQHLVERAQLHRIPEPTFTVKTESAPIEPPETIRPHDTVTPNRRSHPSVSNAVLATRPQPGPEQQLPPIKINIGRVDVRAVMPSAPPAVSHATRPRPAMSLETYLKQREEGKR